LAKPRNKYLDYLAYIGLRIFAMFIHMGSLRANYRLAALLGDLLLSLDRYHRRIVLTHLELSFPHWSRQRIEHVARESMRSMLYMGLEVLLTPRLIRSDTWHRYVVLKDNLKIIRLLIQHTKGLVTLTGHFGNWEIAGYVTATIGFPTYTVARPLDNPYVNEYVMGVRQRAGQTIIYKKGAAEQIQEVLARGDIISFVCDQDAGRKGLFVDFFARPASTFKSIGLMAMQFETPLILMCCKRLDEQFHFECWPQRVIYPHEWADKKDPLRWITQEYTAALEQAVRDCPEQYFWAHRRWKHRPRGEQPAPDGIA